MAFSKSSFEEFLAASWLNPMDRHLARLMEKLAGAGIPDEARRILGLSSALVSRELARGHSCISLADFAGKKYPAEAEAAEQVDCPELMKWTGELGRLEAVVGSPGNHKPLILDGQQLFLHRYWSYEQSIAKDLRQRSQGKSAIPNLQKLKADMAAIFPRGSLSTDWQKAAAFAAAYHRVSVITGGPGTGKTWTVARVLALLLQQPGGDRLRVRLAAPTGKAAARLQETLADAVKQMPCDESVRTRLKAKEMSMTLHRLLGVIPNSPEFRHHAGNPLPLDVLIVDEASMISLPLMSRLLSAFPMENTRLILVGDKDQLPPVDPGSVFADLCRAACPNQFSPEFCAAYRDGSGESLPAKDSTEPMCLPDAVVQLQTNHRSGAAAVLNAVSQKVNRAETAGLIADLKKASTDGTPVAWEHLPKPEGLKQLLRQHVLKHYQPVLEAGSAAEAIARLAEFRILCAVREGPYGVENINRIVEEILRENATPKFSVQTKLPYPGKPVMVMANSYAVRLFNGDIGVFWPSDSGLLVHFPDEESRLRAIARERLPEHETAFALTVHKSQGSEFRHVLLLMPDRDNPVMTRELVYTGLTRAKETVRLICNQSQLESAINRTARRNSGFPSRS